ncbi:hypothetical protein Zmor_012600 [Zophobas morio]|uniref:Uncharacterized protein n=1 Tax=Zophobas morio TaxID=2755281 RepID=A0AA38IDY0_9CUCU|nr:hypothetical protein Zmor_012600 [Zophobas morio]
MYLLNINNPSKNRRWELIPSSAAYLPSCLRHGNSSPRTPIHPISHKLNNRPYAATLTICCLPTRARSSSHVTLKRIHHHPSYITPIAPICPQNKAILSKKKTASFAISAFPRAVTSEPLSGKQRFSPENPARAGRFFQRLMGPVRCVYAVYERDRDSPTLGYYNTDDLICTLANCDIL